MSRLLWSKGYGDLSAVSAVILEVKPSSEARKDMLMIHEEAPQENHKHTWKAEAQDTLLG